MVKFELPPVRVYRPQTAPPEDVLVLVFPSRAEDRAVFQDGGCERAEGCPVDAAHARSVALNRIQGAGKVVLAERIRFDARGREDDPAIGIIHRTEIVIGSARKLAEPRTVGRDLPDVELIVRRLFVRKNQPLTVIGWIHIEDEPFGCLEDNLGAIFRTGRVVDADRRTPARPLGEHYRLHSRHPVVRPADESDARTCGDHLRRDASTSNRTSFAGLKVSGFQPPTPSPTTCSNEGFARRLSFGSDPCARAGRLTTSDKITSNTGTILDRTFMSGMVA